MAFVNFSSPGTFLYIFFKIDILVKEEKSFEGFSIFSSGGHPVQWRRTVWAILVELPKEPSCEIISKSATGLAEEVV